MAQKVKFHSVEEFLNFLPENELQLVNHLRNLIFQCLPHPTEKLLYNVPFYLQKSRICFIWPSSVPWGNVEMDGVQLGFPNGYRMRDELDFLEKGNRKQVYTKTFFSLEEMDDHLIKTYLIEALRIDELGIK